MKFSLALFAAYILNVLPQDIPNLRELDCKIAQYAFEYGTAKVASSPQALHDALCLWNCTDQLTPAQLAANAAILAARRQPHNYPLATRSIYVSPSGDDGATGSKTAPVKTLAVAAALAVKTHASSVVLRGGKYFLSATLELGPQHSGISWMAYPGERPVVSGGVPLTGLKWAKYRNGILMAKVDLPAVMSDAERRHYAARPNSAAAGHDFGPPAQTFNTLFADGRRQVRARFPNGDPQDNSGLCFSAATRDGEGCAGFFLSL